MGAHLYFDIKECLRGELSQHVRSLSEFLAQGR